MCYPESLHTDAPTKLRSSLQRESEQCGDVADLTSSQMLRVTAHTITVPDYMCDCTQMQGYAKR